MASRANGPLPQLQTAVAYHYDNLLFMQPSSNQRVESAKPPKETQRLACEECGRKTNHRVLASVEEYDETPDGDIRVWIDHWVVQCRGCNTLAFCRRYLCSEDLAYDDDDNSILIPNHEMFPHRLPGRQRKEYGWKVPDKIRNLYEEAYTSLCNDLNVLASIGMRAVLEMVCRDKGFVKGNLRSKINDLAKKGIVVSTDAEILHNLRFLGNESAHEAATHTTKELIAGLTVIEHLLTSLYVLPREAKRIPSRPTGT